MKTASQVAQKYAERAANAAGDYVAGAQSTTKDQAAAAIAAKTIYQQALTASFGRGSYEKGLGKSGKSGWLRGVVEKGGERFGPGAAASAGNYATESGRFDGARGAANSLPRGLKGSDTNIARVRAVVSALRTVKVGAA